MNKYWIVAGSLVSFLAQTALATDSGDGTNKNAPPLNTHTVNVSSGKEEEDASAPAQTVQTAQTPATTPLLPGLGVSLAGYISDNIKTHFPSLTETLEMEAAYFLIACYNRDIARHSKTQIPCKAASKRQKCKPCQSWDRAFTDQISNSDLIATQVQESFATTTDKKTVEEITKKFLEKYPHLNVTPPCLLFLNPAFHGPLLKLPPFRDHTNLCQKHDGANRDFLVKNARASFEFYMLTAMAFELQAEALPTGKCAEKSALMSRAKTGRLSAHYALETLTKMQYDFSKHPPDRLEFFHAFSLPVQDGYLTIGAQEMTFSPKGPTFWTYDSIQQKDVLLDKSKKMTWGDALTRITNEAQIGAETSTASLASAPSAMPFVTPPPARPKGDGNFVMPTISTKRPKTTMEEGSAKAVAPMSIEDRKVASAVTGLLELGAFRSRKK